MSWVMPVRPYCDGLWDLSPPRSGRYGTSPGDLLDPLPDFEELMLLQVGFGETDGGADHEFPGITFAFEEADHAMTGIQAGGDLHEDFLEQFREGDGLAAGSGQHGELPHLFADFFGAGAARVPEAIRSCRCPSWH